MVNAENLTSSADSTESKSELENRYDSVSKEVQELGDGPEDPDKIKTIQSELNWEFEKTLSENQDAFSALQKEIDKMKNNPDLEWALDQLSGFLDDFNKSKNGMENSFDDFNNNVENSFDDFKNEVMQTDTVVAQPPEQPVATNHWPLEFKEDNIVSAQPAEQPVATNHWPVEFKWDL